MTQALAVPLATVVVKPPFATPSLTRLARRTSIAVFFGALALYQFPTTRVAVLDTQVPYFALALVPVLAVAALGLNRDDLDKSAPAMTAVLLLAIATCVTGLAHPDQDWGEAIKRVGYVAVGALLALLAGRDRVVVSIGLLTYALVAAGMAIVGFALLAQGVGEARQAFYFGLHYTSSTRNGDAYFLLLPAFVALGFLSTSIVRPVVRAGAAVALIVLSIGLLLSFSRGAWLATAAGLTLFLLLGRGHRRPLLVVLGVIAIAAALIVSQVTRVPVASQLYDRATSIAQITTASSNSNGERLRLLEDSAGLIAQHPLTGSGVGLLERAYSHLPDVLGLAHAENAYVTVLAEYGVLGLFSLLLVVAWPLVRLRPRRAGAVEPMRLALFCGLIVLALNAFTDNPVASASYWILPLFIGAAA
jgi:O-antigen ligase